MLVLTRKLQEEICVGNNVKIRVLRISGNSVRIGIEAPRDVRIVRGELELRLDESPPGESAASADDAIDTAAQANAPLAGPTGPLGERCARINRWSTGDAKKSSTLSLLAARCRSDSCRRQAS